LEAGSADVRSRTVCSGTWIVHYETKRHTNVKIVEVWMVEDVVDLPAQLKFTLLLSEWNVFEERQIAVEDRGQANVVPGQIPDLTRRPGF
jgi:hypothetical protein